MSYVYLQRSIVRPPVVFRRQLLPLSLGHVALLQALVHPVLERKWLELSEADLMVLTWVCSLDYETAKDRLRSGAWENDLAKLKRKNQRTNIESARADLSEYFKFFSTLVPRLQKAPTPARTPWYQAIFAALQKNTNGSFSEVWNMAIPEAVELCAALAVNEGDDSYLTEFDQWADEQE